MAESAFEVTYDGPALADGRMAVRDLAPALLALGDVFAEASVVAYPDRKPVALSIKATEEGSFVVQLLLESAWDQIIDIFGSDAVGALINLKELVIGSAAGLFFMVKRLRGRTIVKQETLPLAGQIRLELDDGTTIEVPSAVMELYQNVEVRRHVRQVVEPLRRNGIDVLEFRSEERVTVRVEADEVDAYDLPEREPVLLGDQELTMVVTIASVAFVEGNKWRLTDGEKTFHALIGDEQFLRRVEDGVEVFRKGDMLRCRIRIIQSQTLDGLHTEYQVVEVVDHIPRAVQMRLDGAA